MSLPDNFKRAMERRSVYADPHNCNQGTIAKHQPVSGMPLADGGTIQNKDGPRHCVRIVSYAVRLRDADNIFVKHALDCLRDASIIPDDSPEHITLEITQVRVKTKAEEKTIIEISC